MIDGIGRLFRFMAAGATSVKSSGLWHAAALASTIICVVLRALPGTATQIACTHRIDSLIRANPIALRLGELATSVHRTQCVHVGSPCQRQCVHASRHQKTSFLS